MDSIANMAKNKDIYFRNAGLIIFLTMIIMFSSVPYLAADDAYRIGSEDVVEIKFWQDNTLDATVKVRLDGKISLDIIGEIDAAGLTSAELEKAIVRQMSRYNKAISQAVVRVVSFGNQRVFISGQVHTPGKYSFEKIPDIWELINEAGGVTEQGDLTRVTIIRGGDRTGEVEVVNVSSLMSAGGRKNLPVIYADDTIEIPRTPAGIPGRTIGEGADAKNIFYVVGEASIPGPHQIETNIDLLDAIALAGGPTPDANTKKVTVISKDGFRTQTLKINLKDYQKSGTPGRYFIRPEDTIVLDRRRGGLLGMGSIGDVVTLLGAVSTALIIYDRLKPE